ncbi:MAG: tetratricopeptide repeat protein [Gemmatimonadota bacterium]
MDRDALLERALSQMDEGDWEGAADLLREYLDDFDDDPAVHCWLGVAEREMGAEGVAYERFKRALALEPEDPYVLATAGNGIAYFDDADAERALRTAALTAPELAVTRLMYGAYLVREGFSEDGLRELGAARELDPDDPQIAYELGVGFALAEDHDRATDALADAVRLDPEDGWNRVVFGLELIEADRLEEAVGELVAGARLREEDVDAQLAAALASAAIGREGTAYEMLERARIRAADPDLTLVTGVEDRLDGGYEAATSMLVDEFGPNMLRTRLAERP